jgi:hypothetical protein
LAGTDRKDREVAIGEPAPVGPMIAPLHLSDLAQLHFRSIAAILEAEKRSSPHYAEHVGLLALRLEQIQRWQAVLEMEGDTFTSVRLSKVGDKTIETRMIRARPEVAMLDGAMRHAQSLPPRAAMNCSSVGPDCTSAAPPLRRALMTRSVASALRAAASAGGSTCRTCV